MSIEGLETLTVRLNDQLIENLVEQMQHVGADFHSVVDPIIDDIIKDYPWRRDLAAVIEPMIKESITDFFTTGQGKAAMDSAIKTALAKALAS